MWAVQPITKIDIRQILVAYYFEFARYMIDLEFIHRLELFASQYSAWCISFLLHGIVQHYNVHCYFQRMNKTERG